jgi:hypothetical protein
MKDDALLARASSSVEEKMRRGTYSPGLLAALAEPLDVRPDPSLAGGVAWPEAVRTATVTVEAPPRSTRPLAGPVVTALKRAVQRSLGWYLPPVAEQITRHNRAVIEVLAEHNRQIVDLHQQLARLRRRVAELETARTSNQGDDGTAAPPEAG